jgi:hypothetical protein
MRNGALLWYLIGRRRGRREALIHPHIGPVPITDRKPRSTVFFVLLACVVFPFLAGIVAFVAALIERIY